MDKYIGVSDQVINYDKSSMIFSRHMQVNKRHQIWSILGLQEVLKHDKYLGMPATVGRSKKDTFGILQDHIRKRIND